MSNKHLFYLKFVTVFVFFESQPHCTKITTNLLSRIKIYVKMWKIKSNFMKLRDIRSNFEIQCEIGSNVNGIT